MKRRPRHGAWLGLVLTACPGGGGSPRPPDPIGRIPAEDGAASADVVKIACGDFHTCALMKDHTLRCWGRNKSGELGDGSDSDRPRPVTVSGLNGVDDLALGANFSCAKMIDKSVKCWGSGRILGDGKIVDKAPPTTIADISHVQQLRAGGYMICALTNGGDVKCWGLDPRPTGEPKGAVELAVAGAHGCGRMSDGTVRCWGEGIWGSPVGKESFANPGVRKAKQIATGDGFGCALVETGAVMCWGRNDEGELGTQPDSDNHPPAAAVPRVSGASQVAAAESHMCAITGADTVTCWGANDEGELGRRTRTIGEQPQAIENLHARQIALGADHGCAMTPDGVVLCWGSNRNGQLGDGTTDRNLSPTRVTF